MKARVAGTRRRLEDQRPANPLVDLGFRSVQLHEESGGALLAGAIAFRFFLFLVPAVFVLVVGLGVGADAADADPRQVARQAGIAGVAATAIRSGATASTTAQWLTLAIATVALVAGARNLFKALWLAHALIWRVGPGRPRHATRAGLGVIVVFAAATLLLRLVYAIRTLSLAAWVVGLLLYVAVPAVVWLVVSLRAFPTAEGAGWRDLVPGALLFGVGVQALQLATVFWVAQSVQAKSQAYGAIGAALTILLWAYLLGRLVTSSAALNAALWRAASLRRAVSSRVTDRAAPPAPPV